jgi:hypothetical protein
MDRVCQRYGIQSTLAYFQLPACFPEPTLPLSGLLQFLQFSGGRQS